MADDTAPMEEPRGYAWRGWPVFPREPFVPLPSLGEPTEKERTWMRRQVPPRERRNRAFQAKSIADWGKSLTSERPVEALRAVRYLSHIILAHEERIIRRARAGGMTWDEIGQYLGVSRQAVHKRWAAHISRPEPDPSVERGLIRPRPNMSPPTEPGTPSTEGV